MPIGRNDQGADYWVATVKSNSVPDSRGSYGPKSELRTRMYHFYALNRAEFLQPARFLLTNLWSTSISRTWLAIRFITTNDKSMEAKRLHSATIANPFQTG